MLYLSDNDSHPSQSVVDFLKTLLVSPDEAAQGVADQNAMLLGVVAAEDDAVFVMVEMPGFSIDDVFRHVYRCLEIDGIIDDDGNFPFEIGIELGKSRTREVFSLLRAAVFPKKTIGRLRKARCRPRKYRGDRP